MSHGDESARRAILSGRWLWGSLGLGAFVSLELGLCVHPPTGTAPGWRGLARVLGVENRELAVGETLELVSCCQQPCLQVWLRLPEAPRRSVI